jgi:protease IV
VIVLRLLRNLALAPLFPLWWVARLWTRPKARWIRVKLSPRLVELVRPEPWYSRFVPRPNVVRPTSLGALRKLVEEVQKAPDVRGVLFEMPSLMAGWVACHALREMMVELRASNREVVVYLPSGGGNRELFVASAATRIIASPSATMAPIGLAASRRHLKGLLERFGLEVEVYRRAEYKTAAEGVSTFAMSEPQREQTTALLATYERALIDALKERSDLDEPAVRALFDRGLVSGQAAIDCGLIDELAYDDEVAAKVTGDPDEELAAAHVWLSHRQRRFFVRVLRRSYVAIIPVHGAISDAGQGPGAAKDAVVSAIRRAARDPRALGVILHVDSPGGSALASDIIHREVMRLKDEKPVVACFGEVAASGGYYVSAGANSIVADPLTITGSIGVISARLVASGLLDRIGVRTEVIRLAPHADMISNPRAATDDERAMLDREVGNFYDSFVEVVANGRGRPVEEVEPLARGRVWSGKDAEGKGLIDRMGGLSIALDEVKARLGRRDDELPLLPIWPKALDLPPQTREKRRAVLETLGITAMGTPALAAVHEDLETLIELASSKERALAWADVPTIE